MNTHGHHKKVIHHEVTNQRTIGACKHALYPKRLASAYKPASCKQQVYNLGSHPQLVRVLPPVPEIL
eukprot:3624776-Amphidinium_carterae.1